MKSRLVIIKCAGYIFWQLFLRQLYLRILTNIDAENMKTQSLTQKTGSIILAVRKAGHDFEACVLIYWLANTV